MAQPTQSTCTLQEEDKIIDVEQGGCFPWGMYCTPYCAYEFVPRSNINGCIDELFDITYDIMKLYAKDKVVRFGCQYRIRKKSKSHFLKIGYILNMSKTAR